MTKIDRAAVLQVGAALFAARPEHCQTAKGLECLADAAVDIVLALDAAIPRRAESLAEGARALKAKAHAEKVAAAEREAHDAALEAAEKSVERAAAKVAELRRSGRAKLRAVA